MRKYESLRKENKELLQKFTLKIRYQIYEVTFSGTKTIFSSPLLLHFVADLSTHQI